MSIAVPVQPPAISIAAAPAAGPPPPEITLSAVSHGSLPAATITMALADATQAGGPPPAAPPPPTSSLLVQQPPPGATIAVAAPAPAPAPPQVQETRLVSYPITSIRQM